MKKYKEFVFYADRQNRGATGGPGGMLYMQQLLLKNQILGRVAKYVFRNEKNTSSATKLEKGILQVISNEIFKFNRYYITNEIATACGLALLKKDYSLIFHQQGPIIEERKNFGRTYKKFKSYCIHKVEKIAFEHAKSVHFPSKGAEEMYFTSSYRSTNRENVQVGDVLPNTIEIVDSTCLQSPVEENKNYITFLCVGTLTKAKGQDQTLIFIENLLEKSKTQKYRLILVGSGVLKNTIICKGKKLAEKYDNFDFIYFERLSHDEVLALNRISDVYIMLHRISIFDLATLEAMVNNSAIILSNVGGNLDFNKENNCILVDMKNIQAAIDEFLNTDLEQLKIKNKETFDKYFSNEVFVKNYTKFLEKQING